MGVTETSQEIRALARQFASERLRPHVEQRDRDRALGDAVIAELAELGFFGMNVPEAFGGMEFDRVTYAVALEELAWGDATPALLVSDAAVVAELLLRSGTEEQKRRWLEKLASGAWIACAAARPESGEPVRATADGSGWKLTGEARWVACGGRVGLLAVTAITGAGVLRRFLVPGDSAGYQIVDRESTMGFRAIDAARVRLNGVRVNGDAVLAADAEPSSDLERLGVAAIALGIAQAALDHALAYANQREQFGEKLRGFEGIQLKLANVAIRVAAARALITSAASVFTTESVAAAKVFASEAAMEASTQAVQVFGGYGYMRDYPVEKLMRDAKGTELLGGANDRLRVEITEALYGDEA